MDTVKYEIKLFPGGCLRSRAGRVHPGLSRLDSNPATRELLIDVADYRHVPQGPGVVLIAHDAHYVMDLADDRLGLLYSRRRETHPSRCAIQSVEDRLRSVWHCALTACQQLEAHPALQGRLQFRSSELLLRCNDRLHAPNTTAAYDELCQYLTPFLATLYADQHVEVEHLRDHASRLTVAIKIPEPLGIDTLLTRLA